MSRQSKVEFGAVLHSGAGGAPLEFETLPALLGTKGWAALGSPCPSTTRRLFES